MSTREASTSRTGRSPLTAFAPSQGLGAKPDNLHFDAPALHELGDNTPSLWPS